MTFKTTKALLEVVTLIYGAAIWALERWVSPGVLPLGWIAPAFFCVYEGVFVWLFDRYDKMTKPQSVVYASMIMRGVKFLGVAVMMLVWVWLEMPAKNAFLLYTLGFYLLTSLLEGWSVTTYNKERKK